MIIENENLIKEENDDEKLKKLLKKFYNESRVPKNDDTEAIFLFLLNPKSILKMITMSEFGFPALSGVVKELELKFGDCEHSPLHHNGKSQNMFYRQNVGRTVRWIMENVGYTPKYGKINEHTKIPKWAGSKYFSTSVVYEKNNNMEDSNFLFSLNIQADELNIRQLM